MKNNAWYILALILCLNSNLFKSQITYTLPTNSCQNSTVNLAASTGSISASSYSWTSIPSGVVFSTPNTSNTSLSFTSSGSYTISVLVMGSGGNFSSSKTISITPYPILPLTSINPTICFSQAANLSVSGANSYSWSPSSGLSASTGASVNASPSISTLYSVSGTSSLCGTSSATFNVFVSTFPLLSYAASAYSICPGETATISAFGAQTYSWTSNTFTGTITQASITASAGSYFLIGSNGGNCTSTLVPAITIHAAVCTGIQESNPSNQAIRLFPNPCSEKLILRLGKLGITRLEIIDLSGKIIYKEEPLFQNSETPEIDVSVFPAGLYFLNVFSQYDQCQTLKFIKE